MEIMAKLIEGEGMEAQGPELDRVDLSSLKAVGGMAILTHLTNRADDYVLPQDFPEVAARLMLYAGRSRIDDSNVIYATTDRIEEALGKYIVSIVGSPYLLQTDLGADRELFTSLTRLGERFPEVNHIVDHLNGKSGRKTMGPMTIALGTGRHRYALGLALLQDENNYQYCDIGKVSAAGVENYIKRFCIPSTKSIAAVAEEYEITDVKELLDSLTQTRERFVRSLQL